MSDLLTELEAHIGGKVILAVLAGSRGHGFDTPESDYDIHGVFVKPTEIVLGLDGVGTETYEWKGEYEGTPCDFVMHEIGKFLHLCLKGNPTALDVLAFDVLPGFSDDTWYDAGSLGALLPKLLHKNTLKPFLGYAKDQLRKLDAGTSVHGKGGKPSGKWAAHVLRILWQGLELAETGHLIVRFNESQTKTLLDTRSGTFPLDGARAMALEFISHLEEFVDGKEPTPLPDKPDREAANAFLLRVRGL